MRCGGGQFRLVGWLWLLVMLLLGLVAGAREREYQVAFARRHRGQVEYVLSDGTRVDILTATHAIEVDFAKKWAEAVGQALHYAAMTKRRAGILLILQKPSDQRYVKRVEALIRHLKLKVKVWTVAGG